MTAFKLILEEDVRLLPTAADHILNATCRVFMAVDSSDRTVSVIHMGYICFLTSSVLSEVQMQTFDVIRSNISEKFFY